MCARARAMLQKHAWQREELQSPAAPTQAFRSETKHLEAHKAYIDILNIYPKKRDIEYIQFNLKEC